MGSSFVRKESIMTTLTTQQLLAKYNLIASRMNKPTLKSWKGSRDLLLVRVEKIEQSYINASVDENASSPTCGDTDEQLMQALQQSNNAVAAGAKLDEIKPVIVHLCGDSTDEPTLCGVEMPLPEGHEDTQHESQVTCTACKAKLAKRAARNARKAAKQNQAQVDAATAHPSAGGKGQDVPVVRTEQVQDQINKANVRGNEGAMLSVADIARDLGMNPKVARAKLRRKGLKANDGRWAHVTPFSEAHRTLVAMLKGDEAAQDIDGQDQTAHA
jgi:hypothetical protein